MATDIYLPCISACREKVAMGQRVGLCYTCVEELRLSARVAIDAGERMIATLTKERDEAVELLRRIVERDGLNDNQWFWLHDCKELLNKIDGVKP